MTRQEVAELIELVRAVAQAEIMPRFRRLRPGDIQAKSGPLDMVTVADEAAEARLTEALRARYPGCTVVGEEAVARDEGLLGAIAGSELCFIIDPIDGTANFVAGVPLFGTMLAVTRAGRTVASVIYDPVGDDSCAALAGGGAWREDADGAAAPLVVADPAPLESMVGTVSWRFMPEPRRSQVCANLPRVAAAFDYRCAAHQYRMLSGGHYHFVVFHRLLPWDHAAGVLLHEEAGGYAALLDGSPYSPAVFDGGLICAPDRAAWDGLRAALFRHAFTPAR